MESQPQNPEFRNNPENLQLYLLDAYTDINVLEQVGLPLSNVLVDNSVRSVLNLHLHSVKEQSSIII